MSKNFWIYKLIYKHDFYCVSLRTLFKTVINNSDVKSFNLLSIPIDQMLLEHKCCEDKIGHVVLFY